MASSVVLHCPQCGQRYRAAAQRRAAPRCPKCGAALVEATAQRPERPARRDEADPPSGEPWPPRRKTAAMGEDLDLTPMVDVVFQLLIFFMVTAAFALQKSIAIPPPDATEGAAPQVALEEPEALDDYIVVKIYADGSTWVEDSEAPSWQELVSKLRRQRAEDRRRAGSSRHRLLVMASGEAAHEVVVQALDAATAVGMESVRLAPLPEEAL